MNLGKIVSLSLTVGGLQIVCPIFLGIAALIVALPIGLIAMLLLPVVVVLLPLHLATTSERSPWKKALLYIAAIPVVWCLQALVFSHIGISVPFHWAHVIWAWDGIAFHGFYHACDALVREHGGQAYHLRPLLLGSAGALGFSVFIQLVRHTVSSVQLESFRGLSMSVGLWTCILVAPVIFDLTVLESYPLTVVLGWGLILVSVPVLNLRLAARSASRSRTRHCHSCSLTQNRPASRQCP